MSAASNLARWCGTWSYACRTDHLSRFSCRSASSSRLAFSMCSSSAEDERRIGMAGKFLVSLGYGWQGESAPRTERTMLGHRLLMLDRFDRQLLVFEVL